MSREPARDDLDPGRPLVHVEDFCRATGWEPGVVTSLLLSGQLDGTLRMDDTAFGLWDDTLPSRIELEAMGPPVDPAYDPELLKYDRLEPEAAGEAPPTPGEHPEGGPSWTMTWGDDEA